MLSQSPRAGQVRGFQVLGVGFRVFNGTRRLKPEPNTQHPEPDRHLSGVMSEHGKCPMGKYPRLATFFALAFVLVFLAHKLGLL